MGFNTYHCDYWDIDISYIKDETRKNLLVFILGDLNSKIEVWVFNTTDSNGTKTEWECVDHELLILNDRSHPFEHMAAFQP